MPRNSTIKPQDVVPSHPDALACLGDREGWDAAPGDGWTHKASGVTVRRTGQFAFDITTPAGVRRATSATGALCIVDQAIAAHTA